MSANGRSADEFESKHAPSEEVQFLRSQVGELEKKLEAARKLSGEQKVIAAALEDAITVAKPVEMVYRPSAKRVSDRSEVTHVMHLTDLHYGEVIEAREVDGLNEYNPEIAKARLMDLGRKVLEKTNTDRHGHNIPYLHILGTADYISGDIHPELQVTNAFPCPRQAVECGYALGALVMMLAPHFKRVTIDAITLDNHGRITRKNQSAQGGYNNWSYVVAEVLKQHVSHQKNVVCNVHPYASTRVEIGPEKYLMFHGHQLKGWAGLPYYGFDRRVAMEATKNMAFSDKKFTRLLCGHFHCSVDSPYWMIGGSLSGTTAFDHGVGRHMRAHQTSWLVHPKHGQFDFTRWWL